MSARSTSLDGGDYPTYLQDRIAKLEAQLRGLAGENGAPAWTFTQAGTHTSPRLPRNARPSSIDHLIADIEAVPILASSFPDSVGGVSLSTIVLSAASVRSLDPLPGPIRDGSRPFLPQRTTALKLSEHYLDDMYPRLPFFSIQGFWAMFTQVFPPDPLVDISSGAKRDAGTNSMEHDAEALDLNYSYFTILMVLAISSSSLSRSTYSVISSQSQRLFHEALRFRESAILSNTVMGLQSILFLIQYASLNPSVLDAWYLIGVALRNCINLGLHQDPPPPEYIAPSLLETRRRLWWSVYSFDRSMSIGSARPLEISDDVIGCELPNFEIETAATSVEIQGYLQRYRVLQLQSRIFDTLNRQIGPDRDPRVVVDTLLKQLEEWRKGNLPEHNGTLLESEWSMSCMLLFQPCRLLPERSFHEIERLWAASKAFVTLYRQLVEANQIFYIRVASQKIYWAGLGAIYSLWKISTSGTSDSNLQSLARVDLYMTVKDVVFILRTLGERWEDGKLLAEEFDRISSQGIQLMDAPMVTDLQSSLPWQIVHFGLHPSVTSTRTVRHDELNCQGTAKDSKEELQELIAEM